MKTPLLAALMAVTVLTACSSVRESKINPMNWFGKSKSEETVIVMPESGILDNRPLVDDVLTLRVERTPGGAIITATGLPQRQGYWAADLVAEYDEKPVNGVLTYQFRTYPPAVPYPAGTQQSREITAAVFVTDQTLDGVRSIVVKGATNQRSSRR
ncbi:hypothetical protein [Actibacterium sp.]|uniref:hypothetical protein n=1 Tax=Actibacterium sp. TaxID=1872125 RepID=UPI00356235FC